MRRKGESSLKEGSIEICFPESWPSLRYDDSDKSTFYQRRVLKSQNVKAVDFLISSPEEDLFFEIKDFRSSQGINMQARLSSNEPKVVSRAKELLEAERFLGDVVVRRKEPSLSEEVAAKIRDTALGLLAALRAKDANLLPFAKQLVAGQRLRTVFVLEMDLPDFGLYASRLKTAIEQRLLLFDDVDVDVVNGATAPNNLQWRLEVGEPAIKSSRQQDKRSGKASQGRPKDHRSR